MHLVKPYSKGVLTPKGLSEKNDCSVRALANITGMLYSDCHAVTERLGRKFGCSMDARNLASACLRLGGKIKLIERLKDSRLNNGKFIIVQEGHCFAMIDGKIVDTQPNDLDKQVLGIFEFK